MLAETELWREERSQSAVERELLVKSTLERRNIPMGLCEFVCGVREVRILSNDNEDEHESNSTHHHHKNNSSSNDISRRSSTSMTVNIKSLKRTSSSSSLSPSPHNRRGGKHFSSSSSVITVPSITTMKNKNHVFHRLKYFSTRSSLAPLSISLDGSVDKPDARYKEIASYLILQQQNNNNINNSHQQSSSSTAAVSSNLILNGKSVRSALKNLIGQVSKLHEGGCSHNNISLQSVCLVVDPNFGECHLMKNNNNSNESSPNRLRNKIVNERNSSSSNNNNKSHHTNNKNKLLDLSSAMTFLLTRFDYSTEFLSRDLFAEANEDETTNNHHSTIDQNHQNTMMNKTRSMSVISEGTFNSYVSPSPFVNNNNNNNNNNSPSRLDQSRTLAQNMNLKRHLHASLAIAPNILALTVAGNNNGGGNNNDEENNNNNPEASSSSASAAADASLLLNVGTSAEKLYRLFQQRQQAELFNRAQGRRPLPLVVPSCGPVCDVQGLVAITTMLFRHLLDAGDDVFSAAAANQNHDGFSDYTGNKKTPSSSKGRSNNNNNNNQSLSPSSPSSSPSTNIFTKLQHRFWSCDVDPALKKYITHDAVSETYLKQATDWLVHQKREHSFGSNNNSNNSSSSLNNCAFKVLDEVIASPQLAAFRIDSLATKTVPSSSSTGGDNNSSNNNNKKQTTSSSKLSSSITAAPADEGSYTTNNNNNSPSFHQTNTNNSDNNNNNNTDEVRCSISTCGAPAVELRWLLSRVLLQLKLPLPDAGQLQAHPFFWSSRRTAQFIVACAQFFCDDELIEETLRSFCICWPPTGAPNAPVATTSASKSKNRSSSNNNTNHHSSSPSNLTNNSSSSSKNGGGSGSSQHQHSVEDQKEKKALLLSALNNTLNNQQEDPDGVATKHAESLRLALQRQQQRNGNNNNETVNAILGRQSSVSIHTNNSHHSNNSNNNSPSSINKHAPSSIFSGLGSGISPARNRAFPLYKELFGNANDESDEDNNNNEEGGEIGSPLSSNAGKKKPSNSSKTTNTSLLKKRSNSLIHISPIKREQSMMLKNMFGNESGNSGNHHDDEPLNNSLSHHRHRNNKKKSSSSSSGVTTAAGSPYSSFKRKKSTTTHNNTSSSSLLARNHSSSSGGHFSSSSSGAVAGGGALDDDDDEQPPNCLAKELNCSSTLVWWGKGEFRADASSHKDNAAVWLRMLTDTVGSSSHPFSIINTQSGRIRNSRSDLLLFIAVVIARMLEKDKNRPVKICGGDPFEFVSIAVHSRFPGLQLILIELLSRRLTDATIFCQFIAEQEHLLKKKNSMSYLYSTTSGYNDQHLNDGNESGNRLLPLFAATKELWVSSSSSDESKRPFSEECAEMFQFWS